MKHVGVIGCGLMGAGIAQVCAQAGYRVTIVDVDADVLAHGVKRIGTWLRQAKRKGEIDDAQLGAAKASIATSQALDELASCDLVIEAVVEKSDLKKDIFQKLDALTGPHCILASNTSSISITDIASSTGRPEKVAGLHFFNPVPSMKLVEVVRGVRTSDETVERAREFSVSLGKEPVICQDTPAFLVNKLLVPYVFDAIRMFESGSAVKEDIDKSMVHACGYPMGPIALADYVGLDTLLLVGDVMFDEYRETRFAPPVILRRLVQAGCLGRKSGRGFYDYEG